MTHEEALSFPGAPLAERRLHPERMGVYFIIEANEIQYIGSSVNLKLRLDQHRISKRWNRDAEIRWILFHRSLWVEMTNFEHILIYQMCPPQNVVMNPATESDRSWTIHPTSVWAKTIIERAKSEYME